MELKQILDDMNSTKGEPSAGPLTTSCAELGLLHQLLFFTTAHWLLRDRVLSCMSGLREEAGIPLVDGKSSHALAVSLTGIGSLEMLPSRGTM